MPRYRQLHKDAIDGGVVVELLDLLEEFGFGNGLGVGLDLAVDVGLIWLLAKVSGSGRNSYLFSSLDFHAHIGTCTISQRIGNLYPPRTGILSCSHCAMLELYLVDHGRRIP